MKEAELIRQFLVVDENENVSLINHFAEREDGLDYFETRDGQRCEKLDERRFRVVETNEILTVADSRNSPRN